MTFSTLRAVPTFAAIVASSTTAAPHSDTTAETRGGHDGFSVLATDLWLSLGSSLPLADLRNDNPIEGWVGGQGLGFTASGGVRVSIMEELYVRPELVFTRWQPFDDSAFDVIVVEASGAPVDTVAADINREALLGGLRINLDYIPTSTAAIQPYLTGGLGLVYMEYRDVIDVPGFGRSEPDENTLGITAALGVGLRYRRVELLVAATFQEPGFRNVSPSWITTDASLAVSIPLRR